MKKYLFAAVSLALFAAPILALAAPAIGQVHSNVWDPATLAGPLVTCTGDYNPADGNTAACTSLCNLIDTFENIIYFGITLVIWIFVPIAFATGGVMFMLARGNPEKASEAKKVLTGTLIGLGIVLCAYLIVSVFVGVLNIAGVGGFGASTACS